MKKPGKQFRDWPNKAVTLVGMSGVGKTHLASILPKDQWFHYSGDYRIGTQYLDEPILDNIKLKAMEHPFLRSLLCEDAIYIRNNITIDHLQPMSNFLGKIGNPSLGGLSVKEFKRRQKLFRAAEVRAMNDVGVFMDKSRAIYGYPHFLNDAGGSVCGLSREECWEELSARTVILYMRADSEMEATLIERSKACPKPLSYEDDFLDQHVAEFKETRGLTSVADIMPDDFVQWVFPKLVAHRRPQYESLAEQYGHTIDASLFADLRDGEDFIDMVCEFTQ